MRIYGCRPSHGRHPADSRWAARLGDFLDVVDYIYRGDPRYVRPLDMELKDRLNPKKNPFFEHAEGAIFCAYRDG